MYDRGIEFTLELVQVSNLLGKPGPVFREISKRAYALGSDFFFRVNDDTECRENWPKGLTSLRLDLTIHISLICTCLVLID